MIAAQSFKPYITFCFNYIFHVIETRPRCGFACELASALPRLELQGQIIQLVLLLTGDLGRECGGLTHGQFLNKDA